MTQLMLPAVVAVGMVVRLYFSSHPRLPLFKILLTTIGLISTTLFIYGLSLYYGLTDNFLLLEVILLFFTLLFVVWNYKDRLLPLVSVHEIIPACGLLLLLYLENSFISSTEFPRFYILALLLGALCVWMHIVRHPFTFIVSFLFIALYSLIVSISLALNLLIHESSGLTIITTSYYTLFFLGTLLFDMCLYALLLGLGLPIKNKHETSRETLVRVAHFYESVRDRFTFIYYSVAQIITVTIIVSACVITSTIFNFGSELNLLLFMFVLPGITHRMFTLPLGK